MEIPLLDLKAQYRIIEKEINLKIKEVLSSQQFILGKEVEGLEREIAQYSKTPYAVGVSSGSDGLLISLMALGVGPGISIVTSPFSFFATAGAIVRLGAKPVFCDIDKHSFNINPERLLELADGKKSGQNIPPIKGIIPVHLFGQMADMDSTFDVVKRRGWFVVEDAAQAIGAEYPSKEGIKKACEMGCLGVLSFFPSKNLGGYGDGGMVLTHDQDLAERMRLLRVHGSRDKYHYDTVGGNFRLDALQAGVLWVKLQYLDQWQRARQERANHYHELFQNTGLIEAGHIKIPLELYKGKAKNYHTYHQYVIRAEKRNELQKYLKEKGISTSVFYPLGLHLQKCFAFLGYSQGDFPETEKATAEVLALPIYPELEISQQEYIVLQIKAFYSQGRS